MMQKKNPLFFTAGFVTSGIRFLLRDRPDGDVSVEDGSALRHDDIEHIGHDPGASERL